jgi:hypothetical protein
MQGQMSFPRRFTGAARKIERTNRVDDFVAYYGDYDGERVSVTGEATLEWYRRRYRILESLYPKNLEKSNLPWRTVAIFDETAAHRT